MYSDLNVETYKAIIDEAHKQVLKNIGYISNAFQGKPKQDFIPHFRMVAHGEEFFKQTKAYIDHNEQRLA